MQLLRTHLLNLKQFCMKKIYLTIFIIGVGGCAFGQSFSLNDLVGYTAFTPSRFENSIARKGYRNTSYGNFAEGVSYTWHSKKKETTAEKSIFKSDKEDKATIAYQTTVVEEFDALRKQLSEEGYHYTPGAKTELYQKGNLTIQPLKKEEGDKTIYSFRIERKALPKARDVQFAEDFLQFSSQEYLASVFGPANVKSDLFYFSEKEINRCSVLFPNTSSQVIFIWNDEENLRDPAFILVGGQLQAQSSLAYHKQIEQNVWQSRQGIYAGMSLRELQRLNGKSINIWGWQSEQPGVVTDKNTGSINFKELSVVLNCLDCNEDAYYSKNEVLNSDNVLREGRRVYVSSIILLPTKKPQEIVGMRK
jgi:hypothetical protein